jgi:RNA polymerase sigma-70 factor (ECF subfamily)
VDHVRLDRDILLAFREGDPAAFAQVMREFDPLVRSIAGRLFPRPFEQEEAMQEAWVHVFRRREALDVNRLEAFPGWLAVLARRCCLDLRRIPMTQFASADEEEALALSEARPDDDPRRQLEAAELKAAVARFVAALEPVWRTFFELHFVQGQDYADVAAELGISKLRCKYMKKVLAARARADPAMRAALGRNGGRHAP